MPHEAGAREHPGPEHRHAPAAAQPRGRLAAGPQVVVIIRAANDSSDFTITEKAESTY